MQLSVSILDFMAFCEFERKLSRHTLQAYRSDLECFSIFCKNKNMNYIITVEVLRKFIQYLFEEMRLSESSVKRRMACLRLYCRYAAEKSDFIDPFTTWKPNIIKNKKLPRFLSITEVSSLYTAALHSEQNSNFKISLYILIIISTGLRISEFCSVRACDISDRGDAIRILGKGKRERLVYITNPQLIDYLKSARSDKFDKNEYKAYVFVNQRGRPLSPQVFRRKLSSVVEAARLDDGITPHSLRHTAATMLIEQGIDIRIVQKILGHASISTTEIYTHVTDDLVKHAVRSADIVGKVI